MHIVIQPLTKGDIPAVREITRAAWLQSYARFIPEQDLLAYFSRQYSAEALGRLFGSPGFAGFLGLADGQPAGYIKLNLDQSGDAPSITSVYVLPALQGRGLGGRLMNEALRHARTCSVREIRIGVMVENSEALGWYERLGFRFEREEPFVMGATTVAHRIGSRLLDDQDA